ncbi:MAG: hypothetical protein K5634_05880 [Sphaerochaetaceae bacterium]|nr:hypothetical protein [Sphaerochaetaceae bacterium]
MIVSIGEALIDIKENEFFVGGSPLNTALTVARLGSPSCFLGGVSSDKYGNRILSHLIDNKIIFDPVFCNDRAPTMTTTAVSRGAVNTYEFDWIGTSAFSITEEKLEEAFSSNSDINCIFYGSVSFIDRNVRREMNSFFKKKESIIKFFDPNIRGNLVIDRDEYIKALDHAASMSDIVRISQDDLAYWGHTPEELLKICKKYLIITDGSRGSTWMSRNSKVFCPSAKPQHRIVDTIGCGDVYNGAILVWLDRRNKLEDFRISETDMKLAMEFASECAAYNCTREGCNPPFDNEITS